MLIADYQVITDRDGAEHIQDNVYNLVMDYLAAGIDPSKTTIFTHSAVPALKPAHAAVPVAGVRSGSSSATPP